jgi:hypothetical protein
MNNLEQRQKNFREINLTKAREAKRLKLTGEKLALIKKEVDEVSNTVDDKIEQAVAGKVREISENLRHTQDKIKGDFLSVFYKMGGVKGLLDWVKKDFKNRKEYYKLMIGLIKSETQVMGNTNQQQVVLNIIAPKERRGDFIDGEQG